jgi:hypothetical protein
MAYIHARQDRVYPIQDRVARSTLRACPDHARPPPSAVAEGQLPSEHRLAALARYRRLCCLELAAATFVSLEGCSF